MVKTKVGYTVQAMQCNCVQYGDDGYLEASSWLGDDGIGVCVDNLSDCAATCFIRHLPRRNVW